MFINLSAYAAKAEYKTMTVSAETEKIISSLGMAIIMYEKSRAISIIENGADLKEYQSEVSIRKIITPNDKIIHDGNLNSHAYPVVILAAASGQDEIIKAIYKQDKDAIHLRDFQNNDALMWASREGYASTVTLLLSYGFDPLYRSKQSKTSAYDLALEKHKYQVLDVIISNLVQNNQSKQLSKSIWYLSSSERLDLLERYLKLGIKDGYKGIAPRTSLMKAADWGRIDNFKLLAQYGANPYESNIGQVEYNYDPLTYAIDRGEILTYLLENYNYDLQKIFDGQNYLHMAYNRYNRLDKEAFWLLHKKSGLDINSIDQYGNTVLDSAIINADVEYVKLFLSLGMSEKSIEKSKQTSKSSLSVYEKLYIKIENNYNLQKIEGLRTIDQILKSSDMHGSIHN